MSKAPYPRRYEEQQEEVVKVALREIRSLGELPWFVRIVAVLPPGALREPDTSEWLYLHVRTPYSPIVIPGAPLTFDRFDNFVARMLTFLEEERSRLSSIQQELL